MAKPKQTETMLAHLKGGPITPLAALDMLGIYRLGARIFDLREAGHDIHMKLVEVRNRRGDLCHVGEYTLL